MRIEMLGSSRAVSPELAKAIAQGELLLVSGMDNAVGVQRAYRLVSASRIEDSPSSARAIAGKTERWQQLSIKLVCALQVAYTQVNMVQVARLFHFSRYF